jgi:hypothetical protein
MTCPIPHNHTEDPGYCSELDKLQGQGVSLKISKSNSAFSEITQIEYALVQNLQRNDTFHRLDCDVSLLDCADPAVHPHAFTAQDTGGLRNVAKITDFTATTADHGAKVEMCPGYRDGVNVTFPNDPKKEKCPKTIQCDGSAICLGIYNFDRTRQGESSLACEQKYRGDMVVDLCGGRVNTMVKAL